MEKVRKLVALRGWWATNGRSGVAYRAPELEAASGDGDSLAAASGASIRSLMTRMGHDSMWAALCSSTPANATARLPPP